MSDFHATWSLVRKRFDDAVLGLNDAQLAFRLHPETLTIGEMALHVAGVERWFCAQLKGETLEGEAARVAAASTDGVINAKPFPFATGEITAERVARELAEARAVVEPMISQPDPWRAKEIVSALGPIIDGTGAFARLAYHPAYHQAQVYMIATAPGYPA